MPSALYALWSDLKRRCLDPSHVSFKNYGGATPPVAMAPAWVASFPAFAQDVGPKPSPQHRLIRLDPAGNFAPGNMTWRARAAPIRLPAPTVTAGQRFGRLIVIEAEHPIRLYGGRVRAALVRCDCGVEKLVAIGSLRAGLSTSCSRWNCEAAECHG